MAELTVSNAGSGVTISERSDKCRGCGEMTAVRVYGIPRHYKCSADGTISHAEEIAHVRKALDMPDLMDSMAERVLTLWHEVTGGMQVLSGWPGDIGTGAYAMLRARDGASSRGTAGAGRVLSDQAPRFSADMALHLDYVDQTMRPTIGQTLVEADVNGQYLAATGIELGTGEPIHVTSPRSVDGYLTMPGYLRLAYRPEKMQAKLPYTWRAFARLKAGSTISTTTGRYLVKRGVELAVSEALVWPEHRRHLTPWYGLWRDARSALIVTMTESEHTDQRSYIAAKLCLRLLKSTVTITVGGWMRSQKNPTNLLRRDWSDQIIAEAWHRELIGIERATVAGGRILGVRRDALWFLLDNERDDPAGLEFSMQLGKWKIARRLSVSQRIIDAHHQGSTELVVRAIVADLVDRVDAARTQ